MRSLVFGIGVNDAQYQTGYSVGGVRFCCPYYAKWKGMMERCYSKRFKLSNKAYDNCEVCDEWLIFSSFRSWMKDKSWIDKQLDKDILQDGNKTYSPDNCAFIDKVVNLFVSRGSVGVGKFKVGACWIKERRKFMSSCSNPFTKKRETIGYFNTEDEAHNAWRERKNSHAIDLAKTQSDQRVIDALVNRYKTN
tara:strand:+ start:734 stop:1312 length:579 start_codon:yes stop_codon:yes gene_type:complete